MRFSICFRKAVYNQLREKVEEALAAAEALIKLGAAYEDAELARIVNELK